MSTESEKPAVMWVEIIEPRTKDRMYANLNTGECVWDPPQGVHIKRTSASQWWELFDTNTNRFYYYNVASQKTVWHKPENCDIIPLAKLQTMKQNTTDPVERRSSSLSIKRSDGGRDSSVSARDSTKRNSNRDSKVSLGTGSITAADKRNSDHLSSPQGRQSLQYSSFRLPSDRDDDGGVGNVDSGSGSNNKHCNKHQSGQSKSGRYMDSGKSSDSSSLSSRQGYRKLQEGGSLRIGSANQNRRPPSDNFRLLQESSSSHNIPHISLPSDKQSHHAHSFQSINYEGRSPSDKRSNYEGSGKRPKDQAKVSKHQSFDMLEGSGTTGGTTREGGVKETGVSRSLTRSGSFVSPNSPSRPNQYQMQRRGSGGSDDSMHEKYFKSVENTPMSRRKHNSHKRSSDSSPQSPISPPRGGTGNGGGGSSDRRCVRPSQLVIEAPLNYKSSQPQAQQQQQQRLDEFDVRKKSAERLNMDSLKHRKSPGAISGNSQLQYVNQQSQPQQQQQMKSSGNSNNSSSTKQSSHQIEQNRNSLQKGGSGSNKYLSKQNVDRHNKVFTQSTVDRLSLGRSTGGGGGRRNKHSTMAPSDVEYYDNGNISPLYSNWDQDQDHLLPLQHYILEQAKLSGRYTSGDNLDSDSYHSDSHSEHSLSGHEPDNEDSDHSDDKGDYLSPYPYDGAYGRGDGNTTSYSNYYYNLGSRSVDKQLQKDQHSEEVDAKLDSMQGQIYSPVKSHPPQVPKPTAICPPLVGIQKPIPQYPSQQRVKSGPPGHGMVGQPPPPQVKPPVLDQMYSNFPLEGITKTRSDEHHRSDPSSHYRGSGDQSSLPPPAAKQAKATLLQRFQENLAINSEDKMAEMALMKECDIEKFAQDNLNLHSKGIFRKKSSVRDMLSWTGDAISRPMLAIARDKAGKKMACELFKLVQIYMGDRKARQGMTLNSVAMDIIAIAVSTPQLRDELYVQLCRQTTENPTPGSLIRGWELLAICLSFIPPSPTFQPALLGYMNRHRDQSFSAAFHEINKWPTHVQISHYATIACRRLDRIGSSGKKQAKKASEDEINHSREQIFRDSMFGNTLAEVMELQRERFPQRKLPWIQVTLSKQVLKLGGMSTEGIFRVPADAEEVTLFKSFLDRWEFPENTGTMDAHTPASLLKLWYRELYDPLVPDELYDECVQTEDPKEAQKIVDKLPKINKMVLMYLINFLQKFAQPEVVANTKMDSSNLAMVFAPNILRCISEDPRVILENARKEMAFLRTLIQHMDTTSVATLI